MANKPKSIIGIDLGHSVFKLAEYNHTKKRVGWVTKKLVESSVWQDETLIAGNLKEILDNPDLHINKKSTGLVLAVYGSQAAFREVQIPADEKNLLDAVSWEMEQYLASPVDDYALDYHEMAATEPAGIRRFLVAAYRKSEIERLKRIASILELSLQVVDVDIFAVLNSFALNYPEAQAGTTLIIKGDLHSVSCFLTSQGQLLGFESLEVPKEVIYGEDEERSQVITTLVASLTELAGSMGPEGTAAFDKVFVCGDLSLDNEFNKSLEVGLSTQITALNSFKQVNFPAGNDYAQIKNEHAPQFATAIGLTMRYKGD